MVAHAQFATADVGVAPGGSETLALTLINLGNHTETFTLVPSGLLAGWTNVVPPTVTLFGGSQETISVTLRPPQLATTPAGPASVTIRVIPQDEPDDVVIAEMTATIGAFHDRRVQLLQPVVRSRRRAVFEFLVENHGNSQASCRLHLIDVSRRLDGDFDPPAVGVEPGGNSLVQLRMKALRRHWRRGPRHLPFSIEADQPGFPTASADATLVQSPVLPTGLGKRMLATAALIAALVGAWFGLIKPLVERTARDAADDRPATIVINTADTPAIDTTVSTTPVADEEPDTTDQDTGATTVTSAVATVPVTVPAELGTGFSKRFELVAPAGQPATTEYTVPAGDELRITDFILQNVNGDGGLATVSKNGEPIQQWNLGSTFDNIDALQLASPVVFVPGDVIAFRLECATVGGITGTCIDALLLSGESFPSG